MTITDPGLEDLITEIETEEATDPVHARFSGGALTAFVLVTLAIAAVPFIWTVAA